MRLRSLVLIVLAFEAVYAFFDWQDSNATIQAHLYKECVEGNEDVCKQVFGGER